MINKFKYLYLPLIFCFFFFSCHKEEIEYFKIKHHPRSNWPSHIFEVISFDYNQDGRNDLILAPYVTPPNNSQLVAIKNNGSGDLRKDTNLNIKNNHFKHIRNYVVADLNNDGIKELIISDHGEDVAPFPGGFSKIYSIHKNNLESRNLAPHKMFTFEICAADLDNDKDIDLYISNIDAGASPPPFFYINKNKGFISKKNLLPLSYNSFSKTGLACAFEDINNDNRIDLILGSNVGDGHSKQDQVLLQDKNGLFGLQDKILFPERSNSNEQWATSSITVADLNNDSYPDTVHLSHNESFNKGNIQIFINSKGHSFIENSYKIKLDKFTDYWFHSSKIVDINNDGLLDIIILPKLTTSTKKSINFSLLVLINQNKAQFKEIRLNKSLFNNKHFVGFTVEDYDKDTDLDIMAITDDGYYLLENQTK
jgi:hypothetical protein